MVTFFFENWAAQSVLRRVVNAWSRGLDLAPRPLTAGDLFTIVHESIDALERPIILLLFIVLLLYFIITKKYHIYSTLSWLLVTQELLFCDFSRLSFYDINSMFNRIIYVHMHSHYTLLLNKMQRSNINTHVLTDTSINIQSVRFVCFCFSRPCDGPRCRSSSMICLKRYRQYLCRLLQKILQLNGW